MARSIHERLFGHNSKPQAVPHETLDPRRTRYSNQLVSLMKLKSSRSFRSRFATVNVAGLNAHDLNALMLARLRSNDVAGAEMVYCRMTEDTKTAPHVATFAKLITYFASGPTLNPVKLKYYFEQMDQRNVDPTPDVYASLLRGFALSALRANEDFACLLGKKPLPTDEILQDSETYVLNHMKHKQIVVDTTVLNALVYGRVLHDDIVGALKWRTTLTGFAHPNARTFELWIEGYCNKGTRMCISSAMDLLHTMETSPDPSISSLSETPYITLYTALIRLRDMDAASKVITRMLNHGIVPTITTDRALLFGYATCGELALARKQFEKTYLNFQIKPTDNKKYSADVCLVTRAYIAAKDWAGLLSFLRVVKSTGYQLIAGSEVDTIVRENFHAINPNNQRKYEFIFANWRSLRIIGPNPSVRTIKG
ncbi:hypothetical protein HDU85_003256 [Gaertneriomyces sp. JEL0708]|nr:hypothetical protein HDU85_003256 [Gaertneriomyces sp. JEL0708]